MTVKKNKSQALDTPEKAEKVKKSSKLKKLKATQTSVAIHRSAVTPEKKVVKNPAVTQKSKAEQTESQSIAKKYLSSKKTDSNKKIGLDKKITNREFKLLLKPEGLDRRSRITQLSSLLVAFCQKVNVEFFHLDNANTGLRNVFFYDTPGEHFRRNNLILRVRESRQNVWVDDWCEVTLKCRAHTLTDSLAYSPKPDVPHKVRLRLKEEILRGDGLGTARTIYSNNAILDTVPVDAVFDRTFKSVMGFFPDLKKLDVAPELPVQVVGGRTNKVLEACLPLGNLVFGAGVQAHCDVGIWMRSVGDPIIGELAFSYRVTNENRDDIQAHKKADKFFKQLQLALSDWLASGTTKTALVYGRPE
jgi:hypothetical protein